MKLLFRNMTDFEYLPYTGLETDIDEETGLHTGEFRPDYGSAVTYRGNISVPSGAAMQAFDGLEVRYSHILVMDDPNADIRETGKIRWKNRLYQITAVRPSLNVLSVAMLAETVDYGDQPVSGEPEPESTSFDDTEVTNGNG